MSWHHNLPVYLCLALGAMLVYAVLPSIEGYQPEFLDQGNVERTQDTSISSYSQRTNAVQPNKEFEASPIQGMVSPFRVNMFNSYIP
jgi:hypothetical protein|uniref:Uncharacterized protein n=1 Tax=viral metagenome TaxID=1070528 RepID=A0A6C0JI50_9ZZZZ